MDTQNIEALIENGQLLEAGELLQAAVSDPEQETQRLFLLGVVHHLQGQFVEAEALYRASLQNNSHQPVLLKNLAHLLGHQKGCPLDAIELLRLALALYPAHVDAALLLAEFLTQQGCTADALKILRDMVAKVPDHLELRLKCLEAHADVGEAVQVGLQAGKAGDSGLFALAVAYVTLNLPESAADLLQLLETHYGDVEGVRTRIAICRAMLATQTNRYRDAMQHHEYAFEHGVDDAGLHYSYACSALASACCQQAWPHFQYRITPFWLKDRDIPAWQGQDLQGKTLWLHQEQDLGDVICALRFIPLLQQRGAQVVLDTGADLLGMMHGAVGVMTSDCSVNPHQMAIDYQLRLLDIPAVLDLPLEQIPSAPYIVPARQAVNEWEARLDELCPRRETLRVGLVWANGPESVHDVTHSTSLADWADLLLMPGIDWISLQQGPSAIEMQTFDFGGVPFGEQLQSVADTAAVMAGLDLIITVCTPVAHLAGAMGKPVWVLLPANQADYRWPVDAAASPWYPSARVFRLQHPGRWRTLLSEEVRPALAGHLLAGSLDFSPATREWLALCRAEPGASVERWLTHAMDEDVLAAEKRIVAAIGAGDVRFHVLAERPAVHLALLADRNERKLLVRSLKTSPQLADSMPVQAWTVMVAHLLQAEAFDEAETLLLAMEARHAHSAQLFVLRGRLLGQSGRYAEGEAAFREALRRAPRLAQACNGLAWCLQNQELWDEVAFWYEKAVLLDPGFHLAWRNLADLALKHDSAHFANVCARKAFVEGAGPAALHRSAFAMEKMGRWEEAADLYRQTWQLEPSNAVFAQNVAIGLRNLGRYQQALPFSELASKLVQHEDKQYRTALAFNQLALGQMSEGLETYSNAMLVKDTAMREWQGEPLGDARLLVFQDQGYGDLMQFAHLVRRLPAKNITLAVIFGVYPLMKEQGYPCEVILVDDVRWHEQQFDCYVSVMKLPWLLNADLVQPVECGPYIKVDPARMPYWQERFAADQNLKVGFVWAGSVKHSNDAFRSTRLMDWMGLSDLAGVSFYSLQKDSPSDQVLQCPDFPLINIAAECKDFADTAAAVMVLDLIICPDTAVAHLAAAMGKKVWILLPHVGLDWRWLLEREDCPWYPSARLFRTRPGQSWGDVVLNVRAALLQDYPRLSNDNA